MKIGKAIKEIRKKKGISQGELAEKLDISQSYLSLVEGEKKLPSLELVKSVSDVLKVPSPLLFILSVDESDFKTKNRTQSKVFFSLASALLDMFVAD